MTLKRKIFVAAIICIVVGAAAGAHNWYYRTYKWPDEIQDNVLGLKLVNARSLSKREGYSHYGEGVFRWRYQVRKDDPNLAKICSGQVIETCTFTKTRRLADGVAQTATYSDGILILEEVWS